MNQPDLGITENDVKLVAVSGLLHDLGHATASHAFDKYLVPYLGLEEHPHAEHESRSIWLLKYMVDQYKIDLTADDIFKISYMINPPNGLENHFLYQVVCNKVNGFDCDKLDYILRDNHHMGLPFKYNYSRIFQQVRVIDNEICFPEKELLNIFELYEIRYKLHVQVFTHPAVTIIECMILDILKELDQVFDFKTWFDDPEKFCKMTDSIITYLDYTDDPRLWKAKEIYHRLKTRQLYRYIGDYDNLTGFADIDNGEYHCIKMKVNFNKGKSNPLDFIKFYNLDDPNKSFSSKIDDFTVLVPKKFEQEKIRVIRKN
jgi:HD superfamily phosphohydrolase